MGRLEKQIKKLIKEDCEILDEIGKLEQKRIKIRLERWELEDQKQKDGL